MLSWRALGLFCNKKTINNRALKTAIRKIYFIDTNVQSLKIIPEWLKSGILREIVSVCTLTKKIDIRKPPHDRYCSFADDGLL